MLFSPWSETTYIAVVDRVRALIESPRRKSNSPCGSSARATNRNGLGFDWNETSAVSTA